MALALENELTQRLVRLLLRHDRQTFRRQFRVFWAHTPRSQPPALAAYDRFVRLIVLADDLLDDIVPRIMRQRSFQTPDTHDTEDIPRRGQVDWERTMTRTLLERPDPTAYQFVTRRRTHTFDTPANDLLIAVLAAYRAALLRAQTQPLSPGVPLTTDEQRELAQIADRLHYELSHLQGQKGHTGHDTLSSPTGTTPEAYDETDGTDLNCTTLADEVEQQLAPGANPYRDLIAWWHQFRQLQLHRPTPDTHQHHPAPVLSPGDTNDTNHATLSHLYSLWFVFELVDLLHEQHALVQAQSEPGRVTMTFRWAGRVFCFVYRHMSDTAPGAVPNPHAHTTGLFSRDTPHHLTTPTGETVWCEPGVVLTAIWHQTHTDTRPDTDDPVRRLLADLHTADAAQGICIVPALPAQQPPPTRIVPRVGRFLGNTPSDSEQQVWVLAPSEHPDTPHQHIAALLDQVVAWLPERPPVQCHGMHQDSDTVNPHQNPARRCEACGTPLVVCDRPHIAPHSVGWVCPSCDCLHNPTRCHILCSNSSNSNNTPDISHRLPPFVRRVLSLEALHTALHDLRQQFGQHTSPHDESDTADQSRSDLFHAIGNLTDSYMGIVNPNTVQIEYVLREGFFPGLWHTDQSPHRLADEVCQMLISGDYVRSRFQHTSVKDWAACAVQYVRALEYEMRRRLYMPCKNHLHNRHGQPMGYFCFGMPGAAYRGRDEQPAGHNRHNWEVFCTQVVAPSATDEATFAALIQDIETVRPLRNSVAHTASVDSQLAEQLRVLVVGSIGQPGLLHRLASLLHADDAGPGTGGRKKGRTRRSKPHQTTEKPGIQQEGKHTTL